MLFTDNGLKKIIYGAGLYGRKAFDYYGGESIYAFVDMYKSDTVYCEKPVLHPSILTDFGDKYEIIVAVSKEHMKNVLDYLKRSNVRNFKAFFPVDEGHCPGNHYTQCFAMHRPPFFCIDGKSGKVENSWSPDIELTRRIAIAYKKQFDENCLSGDGQWFELNKLKQDVHEALVGDDVDLLAEKLSNPADNDLMRGFDVTAKTYGENHYEENARDTHGLAIQDYSKFVRLGEAWGVVRLEYAHGLYGKIPRRMNPSEILEKLEDLFSCQIDFPNPYRGEIGLLIAPPPTHQTNYNMEW